MNKLTKTAKVLDTICAVFFWVLAVAGGFFATVALMEIPRALFNEDLIPAYTEQVTDVTSVTLGDLDLIVTPDCLKSGSVFESAGYSVLFAMVFSAISCVMLKIIRNILRPMKSGQPFVEQTARGVRNLGWVTLIGGTVSETVRVVSDYFVFRTVDTDVLFNKEAVLDSSLDVSFDLSFITAAVVLFLLSWIFHYGCELQQQVDETL